MSECHDDNKTLMIAISNNDYISYYELFNRYYSHLCRYVYGILLDMDDAEDIVQDLFLTLWENRNKIEIRENVDGYLSMMAKNKALNRIRIKNKRECIEENQSLMISQYDNRLEQKDFRNALYGCIDRLPARSRQILLLHKIEGMKQKEISEKLSISVKTIKNHIWISLQKLRKCLESKGYVDPI